MRDFKSVHKTVDGNEGDKCNYPTRLDTYGFAFFAFGGIYNVSQILSIAVASTLVEVVVGICDTPFLYLARKIKEV